MQEQGKSRKPLIIGIVAAVAILAVLLVLLLTQCTGGNADATTTPSAVGTTEPVPTYELYWNADRAEYDGKSEAGMSSRMPEADGYFHVRFILDGEEVVLKVADRKLINAIDVKDLMGLEFDENGIVIGVIDIDDMPLEKLGWQFYVQSSAKTLIKLNSSESMNGMEVLLELEDSAGIYDMTGKSGPVGCTTDPINMDRVYAVANLAGEVTHVFIYQRPNFMLTHEGECQHCKKTVTWYEWTKTDTLPINGGHYQLMNDLSGVKQTSMVEDAKICLDLNGKRVDGNPGSRIYALFNAGTELAIMDTSEEQTGVMAAHGKGDQGMVVWVRYGAFYFYGGTLDASDATTKISGTAIEAGKGKFVYMYGGTIIGGTAEPRQTDSGGWTAGLGGTISLGGKFVMNGGVIRDGHAKAHVTWKNGNPSYSRGIGGNIFMSSSAVFEMNDGEIRNGRAGNIGGNIYMEGAAEFTMNGGKIVNGYINGKGRNGGNVFISGQKTVFTMNGGYIQNGQSRNCAGNVYLNGTFNMNGGVISGGRIRDFKTGATVENAASANVFNVNGQFFMRGGKIAGGFQSIDTDAKKITTRVHLAGRIEIDGGENCTRNFVLSTGGSGIKVTVGNLHEKSNIRVYATTGYFTEKTKEANKPMFSSDIPEAEILYHNERLALGAMRCICGSNSDNVEDHKGECKEAGGVKHVFAPWTSATSMPNAAGKYYLVSQNEVLNMNNTSIVTPGDGKGSDVAVYVDLNGRQIVSKSGRWYSLFENAVSKNPDGTWAGNIADEHIELSICDSVGTAKVTMAERTSSDHGYLIWGRYADSVITVYGGTYDGHALVANSSYGGMINAAGQLNIHGGTFTGGHSNVGGIISAKNVYMDGGVIENGTANHSGGNINISGTMEMHGGIIRGGSINADGTKVGDLGYGGNISVSGTLNMYGGEITGGLVKIGVPLTDENGNVVKDANGKAVKPGGGGLGGNMIVNGTANLYGGVIRDGVADVGGNIGSNSGSSTIILDGVQVLDGSAGNGGNLAINVRANKLTEIKGDTLIAGGTATSNGGNIYTNSWVNGKDTIVNISGGIIRDGKATKQGGNIYTYSTSGIAKLTVSGGQILDGDTTDCGGNIQAALGSELYVSGGLIKGGTKNGAHTGNSNVYSVNSYVELSGGEVVGGINSTNTKNDGCTIVLKGDAKVTTNEAGYGYGMGRWANFTADKINMSVPVFQIEDLSENASIAVSTGGYITTATDEKYVANFVPAIVDAEVGYDDNRIFVGQYACICGGTADLGPCAEGGHKKVVWTPWSGATSEVLVDGHYYLTRDNANTGGQFTMGNEGSETKSGTTKKFARPLNISVNLNGHNLTTGFRLFQLWNSSVLNVADHKGGGALLTKGNANDNFGGIQMLGKNGTVNFYSGKIGFTEGHVSHKEVALVESAGTFNMYGGEIAGDGQPSGTLINVAGTFNMYAGTVRDGYNAIAGSNNASRGGNFRVSGTLNVFGGTISGGKAQYGGNIAGSGKVNISGDAVVTGGIGYTGGAKVYPQGGNIYLNGSNAQLNMNGGTVSGGQLTGSNWMPGGSIYANNKAQLVIDGGALIEGGDGQDGNNIYLTTDGTTATLKNCTIKNTVDGSGSIMVERGNVIIDGATIINTANGYNLRANETGKVANYTFNSGLITGGKPNVNLGGDDTFVMNGGIIENGSSGSGGNIMLSQHNVVTINGGEIRNGSATNGTGGNIVIWDTSEVTINGGTISGGTSTANGGNISVSSKCTLTINGGTITGGRSGDSGGNIVAYGKVVMTGGSVINGQCKNVGNGMNISIVKSGDDQLSTLEITGGKIGGGLHFNNYKGNVTVSISGNPVIDKALSTEVTPTYSMALGKNDLTIGQLTDGAKIVVSGQEGVFSYKAPEGSAEFFESEVDGLAVFQTPADELVLVYGRSGCICGSTDGNHIGECDGTVHNWMPVTAMPETSGYYYMISDFTDAGGQRQVKSDLNLVLDLNGHTLKSDKFRMFWAQANVNFTVTDNSANRDGKIVITGDQDQGSLFWSNGTSTFAMYGGIVDATGAYIADTDSLAGLVVAGSGTCKLFRGAILGGKVVGNNLGGAAVSMEAGKVHILGTEFTATSVAGNPIYVSEGSKIDLSYATTAPAQPWVVSASGIFTKGWNKAWNIEDYFVADVDADIWVDETTGELFMGKQHCVCGKTTHVGECKGEILNWQPWRRGNALPPAGSNWYFTRDIVYGDQVVYSSNVAIDLNGFDYTFNVPVRDDGFRMLRSDAGADIIITDCSGKPGTMKLVMPDLSTVTNETTKTKLTEGNQAMLFWVRQDGGSITLYNGTFDGSQIKATRKDGASVDIGGSGSAFNMHGGTLIPGSIGWSSNILIGGNATMTITGGTIRDGRANNGGNIGVYGTLYIKGGTITGGNTNGNGNNINVCKGGKVFMSGGKVVSTVAPAETAVRNNIYVAAGASFELSGGSIENTASDVRNISLSGTFNMTGGTIKGGKIVRSDNGANVGVWAGSVFNMSGGSVVEGVTANQGGNFAVYGTLKVSGKAVIKDGSSNSNAGHNIAMIHTGGECALEISGGTIAGGIYLNNYGGTASVKLSGAPVIDKSKTSANAPAQPVDSLRISKAKDSSENTLLDVTGLTGGTIYVKGSVAGQFAKNATEGMEKFFVSETYEGDVLLPVCYENNGLYFGKVYCLCGASETGGTHSQGCLGVNGGKELIWVPADSTADLQAGGNFYLTKSFTTGMITLSKNTAIDLNGYTLTKTDGQRIVSYHGSTDVTLTVTDSTAAKKGAMVVSGSKTNQGGLFWLSGTNSKLNLVAGTFDASGYTLSASGGARYGAGIEGVSTSEINIYEGVTLKGGTVTHGNTTNGAAGGSIATSGKLNIFGGTISGGKATSGGNIYGTGASTITISGGTITGGTAIGEKFEVSGETKEVYGLGGNIRADGVLTISGGTIEKGSAAYGETAAWVAGGNLYVAKTVTISGDAVITGGTSDSQGANIYSSGGGRITMSGGTIEKGVGTHGNGIYLDKGAQLTMSAGKIVNNEGTGNGGNIALIGGSKLTVTGGEITGGKAAKGGNIYMEANGGNNPTVEISNITVSGGSATEGGNLRISAGTATFTKATLTEGTASYGGNLYVSGGTLDINQTTVSDGHANNPTGFGQGGNLYTTAGTVNLNAGSVLSGGTLVNGNGNSWKPGANGYLNGGTINIKGTVTGGSTASQGHNFYINNKSVVTVDGGTIANTADNAESIYLRSGTVTIKNGGKLTSTGTNSRNILTNDEAPQGEVQIYLQDGVISGGNTTASGSNGGNISLTSRATMTITGGEITGGKAANCGGNIANYGQLNISGGKIYGGTSGSTVHANIYSQGNITIDGGQVYGGLTMHNLGKANLTLSGSAVVDGKLNATKIPGITLWSYTNYPAKPVTISGKLTGNACIGINMSNMAFANAGSYTADSIKAFYADDTNQGIYLLDSTDSQAGMLYVGQYNCICGGTATKGACAEGGHAKVRWTPWNGTKSALSADGYYYLTTNCTNTGGQLTIGNDGRPSNVSVNLNGHSITMSNTRIFQLWNTSTLNIADHKGGGKLLTKGANDHSGVVQMVTGVTTTVNFYSGYMGMTDTYTTHTSAAIASVSGTFNMYGGTIDGGTKGVNGGNINIGGAGIFNMYGGTVKNGETADGSDGGNFRVAGKLNIYGGTIENGKSGSHGGNIKVNAGGKVVMTAGTIQNGIATRQGGNVNIADGGSFELKGGKLLNGLAAESAGNVLVNGELIVNGGEITGGKNGTADSSKVTSNSNLFAVNGDVTLKGGTVAGAEIINTANNGCTIKIEDDAVVTDANGNGLVLSGYGEGVTAPVIELGALEEGAAICVKGQLDRVFATGTGATFDNKGYFTSKDGYQVICTEEGMMMVAADAHAHCVCGGELAEDESHECVDVIYTEMTASDWKFYSDTDKNAKFRGNYYLTGDLNLVGNGLNLRHDAQVNICLNGHTLTSNTRTVSMFCDGTDGNYCKHSGVTDFVATPVLNIASCSEGGVIASNNTNSENGRVLWARLGDINCYGITIDATKTTKLTGTSTGHTGVAVQTTTADATLYNCVVKGGIDNSLGGNAQFGAAISSNGKGLLTLVGTFELQTANKAMGLYVADGSKIDISRLESVNAPISVSASGVFTEGAVESGLKMEEIFTSFISGMDVFTSVNTDAGEAFFGKASCLCGSTTGEHLGECDGSRLELAAWRAKGSLPKATGNYILISGDIKTAKNTPNSGAEIVLNLNGQTVSGNAGDRIYTPLVVSGNTGYQCTSATLNIVNGTMIPGASGTQGGVFWMGNNVTVSLYNVTVDARGRTATGSGTIADTAAGSIFNMFGNTTLYGGTTANNGGAMAISGELNMWDDSKIIGGKTTATSSGGNTTGGAVYVRNSNAVVTMNDNAIIQDGESQNNGGNVYVNSGKLVMNDNAQILNGKAGNISGNVQISGGCSLEMNGGKISGGTSYYGKSNEDDEARNANVTILNTGKLTMTGGEITGYVNAFAFGAGTSPKITVSGTAKIAGGTKNLSLSIDQGDLFSVVIGEGGLTTGADIQITTNSDKYISGVTLVTNVAPSDVPYIGASVPYLYDNTEKIILVK